MCQRSPEHDYKLADVEIIASLDSPLPLQSPFSPIITPTQDNHTKRECNLNLNMDEQKESGKEFQRLHPSTVNQIMLERDIEVDWEWQQRREEESEANLNKFATLFEPSTPRASPASLSTPLPSLSDAREESAIASLFDFPRQSALPHSLLQRSRPTSLSSSSGSEYGAFVTTSEDPLSFTPIQDGFFQGSMTTTTADELTFLTGSNNPPISPLDTTSSASSGTQPPHWSKFRKSDSKSDSNTTLKFFDEFTHDAERRSLVARSQVLDELLLHEDDPMWFIFEKKGSEDLEKLSSTPSSPNSRLLGPPAELSDDSTKQETEERPSTVLLDIDHDYFRPSLSLSRQHSQSNNAPKLSPTMSRSNSMSPPRPAIAPPITSQLTASQYSTTIAQSGELQSDFQEFDLLNQVGNLDPSTRPLKSDSPPKTPSFNSSSYQTVTSLSSKLMSSLLRGGRDTLSGRMGTHSSMDSILRPGLEHDDTSALLVDQQPSLSFHSSHHLLDERSKSPHSSTGTLPVATSSSLPSARCGRSSNLFTHSPFAPATITHGTSPFSPTVYIPPSGAPGFKGDKYDWDKGFSNELESEWQKQRLVNESNENGTKNIGIDMPNRADVASSRGGWSPSLGFGFGSIRSRKFNSPSHGILGLDGGANRDSSPPRDSHTGRQNGRQSSHSSSTESGGVDKMGEFIDQKIGKVELLGRKISSSPVLMPQLASMLRAHIPALSRLSRSWTLLYSLDQHGISLNTLYTRCELHLSQKPAPGEVNISKGMLLVVKDAVEDGDEARRALFGAWIAEGLKPNKGKGYSGGGESFLFKYIDGNLKVFKTTGKNSYVSLCEPEYISFGGGDGQYGLYLDDSLFEGSSASCPTFDNEPLCSASIVGNMKTVKYECVGLEVWGMGS